DQVGARAGEAVFVARAAQRIEDPPAQARRGGGIAGRELGIDEVAGRDGGVAAALVIELEQAAAAVQRFARVAAHARHPLCRLDAPDEALRGPGRVLERLQLRE